MTTKISAALILGVTLLLAGPLTAQQNPDNDIPDAPSATRPLPPPSPSARPGANGDAQPDGSTGESSSVTNGSSEIPRSDSDAVNPPPMPPVKTVPAGSVPKDAETGQDLLYTIRTTTNLVLVPVTVTDRGGHLIGGLGPQDFFVPAGGKRQTLKFFTSYPFALSAAVIFDTGMPDIGLKKIQDTLSALQGAFSQFDEVAFYTYSSTVGRLTDFTNVGREMTVALNQVKGYSGANNGVPVTSGPLGPQGPVINGIPIGSPVDPVSTPPKVAHVLNDAILLAA